MARRAGEYAADGHLFDARGDDLVRLFLGDHLVDGHEHLAGGGVHHVFGDEAADQAVMQAFDLAVRADDGGDLHSARLFARAAIVFAHDNILRNVDKAAGKVT